MTEHFSIGFVSELGIDSDHFDNFENALHAYELLLDSTEPKYKDISFSGQYNRRKWVSNCGRCYETIDWSESSDPLTFEQARAIGDANAGKRRWPKANFRKERTKLIMK